jgi:flotillin
MAWVPGLGVTGVSRTAADNVAQGIELLGSIAGVDLAELLQGVTRRVDGTQAVAG